VFDTKNNHYVPKAYLENFSTDNLYKLVKKQSKIYYINNLSSECSKFNLYTTKKKISNNMVLLVAKIFKLNKLELNLLSQLQSFINGDFDELAEIVLNEDHLQAQAELNRVKKQLKVFKEDSKTQEELFTFIYEDGFYRFLENIKQDSSIINSLMTNNFPNKNECFAYFQLKFFAVWGKFYTILLGNATNFPDKENFLEQIKSDINKENNINESFFDLLLYLFIQHYRTNSMLKNFSSFLSKTGITDKDLLNNFAFLCVHILSITQAIEYANYSNYTYYIIENKTNEAFITSDNPSCFLNSKNALTIIMPLSENLVAVYSNKLSHIKRNLNNKHKIITNEIIVRHINKIIFDKAMSCIYGRKQILEKLIK